MKRLFLLSLLFQLLFTGSYAQELDSLAKLDQQDSLLEGSNQVLQDLTQQVDSIRKADSLHQAQLLEELNRLTTTDAAKREALQREIDSVKQVRELRLQQEKLRIDSLRANTKGFPVIFAEDTLLVIYQKLGPFSASERASSIISKLELISAGSYDSSLLRLSIAETTVDIFYNQMIITTVTDLDAIWLSKSKLELAEYYKSKIDLSICKYQESRSFFNMAWRAIKLILLTAFFFVCLWLLNRGINWGIAKLMASSALYFGGFRIRSYEVLSKEKAVLFVSNALKIAKWVIIVFLISLLLPIAFSIFPATESFANTIFNYIKAPVVRIGLGFVNYIPELFTIFVILVITRYVVKVIRYLSLEVQKGKLIIPGFYADWAKPTANIFKVLVYAFAFIMIFPYLPGSDSEVFKGVSVFLGILVSVGSSSAIGNMIAGLVITYMRAFRKGDRVMIGGTSGEVVEKTMLVTRLRTIKNEDVTIPNSAILAGSTINYSSSAIDKGLILHSKVTIGYDVPWRKVHELLISAACKTTGIVPEPAPFVLQTSLDDFFVSYQINAYTQNPAKAAAIYSELHQNIQDAFQEAGVEIMSPHYQANRSGEDSTIPKSS